MVGALVVPVTPKELQNSADLCNGNTLRRKHQVCGGFFLSLFPPSSEPSSDRKGKDRAPPISGRTLRNGQIKFSSDAATASSNRANKLCHSQSILIKRFSAQKTEEKKNN